MVIDDVRNVFVYEFVKHVLLFLETRILGRVVVAPQLRNRRPDQYLRRPLQHYLGNLEVRLNEQCDLDTL